MAVKGGKVMVKQNATGFPDVILRNSEIGEIQFVQKSVLQEFGVLKMKSLCLLIELLYGEDDALLSVKRLAERSGETQDTIETCVAELEDAGYLIRLGCWRRKPRYMSHTLWVLTEKRNVFTHSFSELEEFIKEFGCTFNLRSSEKYRIAQNKEV